MNPWLLALRPKTLSAAVVPIVVGSALAFQSQHPFVLWVSVCALLASLFIQVGTNLFNDAIDYKKGADTHERIGPLRVTQSGLIKPKSVLLMAVACLIVAAAFGFPLVMKGGFPILVVGLASLFLAYSYTGGPFPLAYLGLGDVFVVLFFGWISVMGLFYLHTEVVSMASFVAGTQVGLLATVLIAINNLRDFKQDEKAHKKTLAVRFGQQFVRLEIYGLNMGAFLLLIYWIAQQHWWAGILPLLVLPLSLKVMKGVVENEPGPIYNKFLAMAGAVHLLFGLLLTIGIAIKV
ncbi:MAG: 1,4-dihydroxy-2-naphthoate polyprenyltransferase [Bdellovibrionales bacterium]|nr:1,4-dihydroxy-2-naphthoate polyprenyltransferase [Bdellovibrionales bacterium]